MSPRRLVTAGFDLSRGRHFWWVMIAACCGSCDRPSGSAPADTSRAPVTTAVAGAGLAEDDAITRIAFHDETLPDATYDNGGSGGYDAILETLGGGVTVLDYDRDGWPDLLFPGGGRYGGPNRECILGNPLKLLRGTGAGKWRAVERPAGIDPPSAYSHGCAAADFDNDGFADLLVTGFGAVQLFRNQGDGTFCESSVNSGIIDSGWTTGAGWGDLDGDGALDLYLVHYVEWSLAAHRDCLSRVRYPSEICGPKHFSAGDHRVFLSRGDGTFQDGSVAAGLVPGGKGLGVVLGDIDLDGDLDIYVANDTTENFLYLNDGRGRLHEVGVLHGVAYGEDGLTTGSMGVALADYDGDGLPDLWTTNFEKEAPALYRNLGAGRFHYMSRPAGVAAIGGDFVGWGTGFGDFDCDGDLDIVVANGHLPGYVPAARLPQLPVLLINDGRGRFRPAHHVPEAYLAKAHSGRGLALGDLNRDGRIDLAVSCLNEPAAVLLNTTDGDQHTLQVSLVGSRSNRDAIGATAVLETTAGSQLRQVVGGGSYLSQNEFTLHWGYRLGAVLQRLTVHWPSGTTQVIDTLCDDARLIVWEPVPGTEPMRKVVVLSRDDEY